MKAPDLALIGFVAIIIIILAFAAVVLWQVLAGTIKLDGLIAELDPAQTSGLRQRQAFPAFSSCSSPSWSPDCSCCFRSKPELSSTSQATCSD